MPTSNRQLRIAKLLRLASQEKDVETRFCNLESLVNVRGGLGNQTKRAVRAILELIRIKATHQFEQNEITQETRQAIERRIDAIDERLLETTYARRVRLQHRKAENEIFEGKVAAIQANPPKPPGPAYPGFKWRYKILPSGDITWQMIQV
jgi:hypothetical protein